MCACSVVDFARVSHEYLVRCGDLPSLIEENLMVKMGSPQVVRVRGRASFPARRGDPACASPDVLEIVGMRLRVICEPTRVQIMATLDRDGPMSVQALADLLPATGYQNISKHLRTLYDAGMVGRVRRGNTVWYELADWSALWVVEQIAATIADHLTTQRERIASDPD